MASETKVTALRETVERLRRDLAEAQKKSLSLAMKRHALSPGGTRARITTANARWAQAAEQRDRVADLLAKAEAELAAAEAGPC